MINIKIENNEVVLIIECDESLNGFEQTEQADVKIGMVKSVDGVFTVPRPNLNDLKQNLQEKLAQSSKRTVQLLNLKYELTNNLGMAKIMQNEFIAYSLDSTTLTPTIDEWAVAKGRARAEQLIRVGGVVAFTKFSSIMMEQFYSKTDKATTEAEIVEIEAILDELNEYDNLSEVMVKRDEFLRRIRDVGV